MLPSPLRRVRRWRYSVIFRPFQKTTLPMVSDIHITLATVTTISISFSFVVDEVDPAGVEPATIRLWAGCSTNWAIGPLKYTSTWIWTKDLRLVRALLSHWAMDANASPLRRVRQQGYSPLFWFSTLRFSIYTELAIRMELAPKTSISIFYLLLSI